MIPKISRGQDPAGLMRYLVGQGRANEHVEPHLVAGSPSIMAWFGTDELDKAAARDIAGEVDRPRQVFDIAETTADGKPFKHVWHCSLSLRAGEERPTDERWGEIAGDFMRAMEFDDPESAKAPVRWVAVEHGLSANGNPHVHVMASLVREDGTKANPFRDFKRANAACRELERRFGLEVLEGREVGRGSRTATRGEVEKAKRAGRSEPARLALRRRVRGIAVQAESEAEFVRMMRASGLEVRPRFAAGRDDVVSGWMVGEKPRGGAGPVLFGGGSLGRDLTLPRLRKTYGARWVPADPLQAAEAASEAAEEWRRADRGLPMSKPPLRVPVAGEELSAQCGRELGALREWLRTVPVSDVGTWASVAEQASGVFAAWSAVEEGDQPGPLAAASDSLARTAELPAWRVDHPAVPPEPTTPRWGLLAAAVACGGRGALGQALMLRQLRNLARALHDAHVAVEQAQRAQEIERLARGELAVVAARLPPLELNGPVRETARGTAPRAPARSVLPADLERTRRARTPAGREGVERS